ncbi:glycosyltransferase [bacterium]|nr:glycosyltransferase [bacterium]
MPLLKELLAYLTGYNIKISIILPVYNAEKHLNKCIDSILNQNFRDIEIIVVNDCSKDRSLEILGKYMDIHPFIKVINHNKNMGAGVARNRAIKHAKGKYLTFIDSDDWLSENYLNLLYSKAEKTDADITFSNMKIARNNTSQRFGNFYKISQKYKNIGTSLADLPNDWRLTSPWMKLFRRNFVIKKNLNFLEGIKLGAEDIPFSWLAYFTAEKIAFCKDTYYYYNFVPESLDRKINENILQIFDALNYTENEYKRFDPSLKRYELIENLHINHTHYQFTKITGTDDPDNFQLASKYWNMAHKHLIRLPQKNIEKNKYLTADKKEYYLDVINHAKLDSAMTNKYFPVKND